MNIRSGRTFICEEDFPLVHTQAGTYRGYVDDDVFCFKGMDYAWADRFQMPQEPLFFSEIRDAFDYGYGCPEMTYDLRGKKPGMGLIQPGYYWNMDEHVQNLNVWTKSIEPGVKKPVMFWIHGGGFFGGASSHLYIYEGWALAHTYDVVVVSVNHRLNMLGYLDLSEFGDRYRNTGNLGQADLVAALQWVQKNIEQFGGDPDNVTVFGQSGGGGKISTLLQMPAADGLFHKAIIQSGIMAKGSGPRYVPGLGRRTVELLGLPETDIREIESMDYDRLAAAVLAAGKELGANAIQAWEPVPDGSYFHGKPEIAGFRKENAHIPLMIGSCLAEFDPSPEGRKANWSEEKKMEVLKRRFGPRAEEAAALFGQAYPEYDVSYASCVDGMVRPATVAYAEKRTEMASAPVYNYVFAFENMIKGGRLTGHTGDVHFAFHNAFLTEGMRKEGVTERLEEELAGSFVQFAVSGNPCRPHFTDWKPFTAQNHECMIFGDHTRFVENHDRQLLELLSSLRRVDPITGKPE